MKKYRLIIFRFIFIEDRYLFPIILNSDDIESSKAEQKLVDLIIKNLPEISSVSDIRKVHDRIDFFESLQAEVNAIFGEISHESIRTIDIELRKAIPINQEALQKGVLKSFEIHNLHLPIKRLDSYYNDINLNPFVIIEIEEEEEKRLLARAH